MQATNKGGATVGTCEGQRGDDSSGVFTACATLASARSSRVSKLVPAVEAEWGRLRSSRRVHSAAAGHRMAPPPAPASSKVVCAYHYPCPDGVFAALAAYLHLREQQGIDLRFQPHTVYNDLKLEKTDFKGAHVYLLDYSGPEGFVEKLCDIATHLTLLDHHKTAIERFQDGSTANGLRKDLPDNFDAVLDVDRSGATISRDYFQPQGLSEAQQQLFGYIEDADLWRWALKDSKAFHAGFCGMGIEFDANQNRGVWDQLLSLSPDRVMAKGYEALAEQERQIRTACASAIVLQLGGAHGQAAGWGTCLGVRADGLAHLRSQLGNRLAELSRDRGLRAVGVVAYEEPAVEGPRGLIKVSVRSKGEEDTTVISQHYGGGGHKNASSCMVPLTEWEAWARDA